ncbi:hypothetical protein PI125_g23882 [Phytophthora idaei]|nr:hypothetical protein PI125_g23882 [Phytophthora idaei]KAG3127355.1 hypothetical protein PI126_g21890 [Phytophthora idaei]
MKAAMSDENKMDSRRRVGDFGFPSNEEARLDDVQTPMVVP